MNIKINGSTVIIPISSCSLETSLSGTLETIEDVSGYFQVVARAEKRRVSVTLRNGRKSARIATKLYLALVPKLSHGMVPTEGYILCTPVELVD